MQAGNYARWTFDEPLDLLFQVTNAFIAQPSSAISLDTHALDAFQAGGPFVTVKWYVRGYGGLHQWSDSEVAIPESLLVEVPETEALTVLLSDLVGA